MSLTENYRGLFLSTPFTLSLSLSLGGRGEGVAEWRGRGIHCQFVFGCGWFVCSFASQFVPQVRLFSFFFSEWERGGGAVGHELIYTTHDRGFRVSKTELRKITVNFLELSFSKHLVISLY